MNNILCFGAHPDDLWLAMAGFILKNRDKYNFILYCACQNSYKSKGFDKRVKEEIDIWKKIGINIMFNDYGIDTELKNNSNFVIDDSEKLIKAYNPYRVYVNFPNDSHQDHRVLAESVLSAARYFKNVYFYGTASSQNFVPNIFCELKEEIVETKIEISKMYKEIQLLGSSDFSISLSEYIKSNAIMNGIKSRITKYAEGFICYRGTE